MKLPSEPVCTVALTGTPVASVPLSTTDQPERPANVVKLNTVPSIVAPSTGAVTVTDCDVVPVAPWLSVTVSCTVYVPAAPYAWLTLCVVAVPPSPKDQLQLATRPSGSLLASVKPQLRPLQLAENDAVGGWFGGDCTGGPGTTLLAPSPCMPCLDCPACWSRHSARA